MPYEGEIIGVLTGLGIAREMYDRKLENALRRRAHTRIAGETAAAKARAIA